MFDNILLTDLSGMHIPLFYLPLIEDFQSIPLYSKGSGVPVCLYMHMCQASLEKSKQVGGCLLFLQIK